MQRKLYIPTSTLNFNNIISSESISPYSFYQLRGYGFRRFEKVQPNRLDNSILLYDKFPAFCINDKELENYPMVIEVCPESCSAHFEAVGNGIYRCSETIYLNPFNTSIYFNSYAELTTTKSKAEPSIEAKLANLYKGCYKVVDSSMKPTSYNYDEVSDIELSKKALEQDVRINKLKGFAYAYVIAANRSYDSGVVSLKMHFRQLINSISAIITSPNFMYGQLESDEIRRLYAYIRRDIEIIDGTHEKVNQIIKDKIEKYQIPHLVDILREEELLDSWYIKIRNKHNLRSRYEVKPFTLSSGADKLAMLDAYSDYLNSVASQLAKKGPAITPDKLPIIEHGCIDQIPGQKDFIVTLLNMYRNEMVQKDDFLNNRYQYALKGGALFREACGEAWETSDERKYINSLLKNLNEYTAFDVNSTKNQTLKSFAAFFQKGDIEIEKLEDYLISQGIGDLRIAFSLWGIIFGYAEMPKTITHELYDSPDLAYKCSIYKSIYKSLFGIDLIGELQTPKPYTPAKQEKKSYKSGEETVQSDNPSEKSFVEKFKEGCGKFVEGCKELLGSDSTKQKEHSEHPEFLNLVFESEYFISLSKEAQDWYRDAAIDICSGHEAVSKELMDQLIALHETCEYAKTITKWKQAVQKLKPLIKKAKPTGNKGANSKRSRKGNKPSLENSLFPTMETEEIALPIHPLKGDFILSLQCIKRFNDEQRKRLISNWEYTASGHINDLPGHLDYFINLCKKEGRGGIANSKVLQHIFNDEVAQVVANEIKKYFKI